MKSETDVYLCPSCEKELSRKTVNRLRYLVFGVQPTKCNHCQSLVQWEEAIRKKLVPLGLMTNFGIIFGVYAVFGWFGFVYVFGKHDHMLGTTLILIGVTATISVTKNAKLELASKT